MKQNKQNQNPEPGGREAVHRQVTESYKRFLADGHPDDIASILALADRVNSVSFTLKHFANRLGELTDAIENLPNAFPLPGEGRSK